MLYRLSEENGTKKESYENHHHYFYHNEKTFFSLSRVNEQAPNEILHDFEKGYNHSKMISDDSKTLNSPKYISRKEVDTILNGVLTPSRYPDCVASYQSLYSIKNEAKVNRYSSRMDEDRYMVDVDYYCENITTSYHAKYWFDSNLFLVSFCLFFQ